MIQKTSLKVVVYSGQLDLIVDNLGECVGHVMDFVSDNTSFDSFVDNCGWLCQTQY